MTRKLRLLAGAAAIALMSAPAMAQEAGVRGFRAGDFLIGASVIGVLPSNNGGSVDLIGGRPHASNSFTPQLDFTYFVSQNFSLNLIAATTRHDIEARNTAIGTVDLGRVWALPPTLTAQFHPVPTARVSPYVGVGVNYTLFYNEGGNRNPLVAGVNVRSAPGVALNAGVNIELTPRWLLNLDVKYLFLRPDAVVTLTNGARLGANAQLDPWVVGIGFRYRF